MRRRSDITSTRDVDACKTSSSSSCRERGLREEREASLPLLANTRRKIRGTRRASGVQSGYASRATHQFCLALFPTAQHSVFEPTSVPRIVAQARGVVRSKRRLERTLKVSSLDFKAIHGVLQRESRARRAPSSSRDCPIKHFNAEATCTNGAVSPRPRGIGVSKKRLAR